MRYTPALFALLFTGCSLIVPPSGESHPGIFGGVTPDPNLPEGYSTVAMTLVRGRGTELTCSGTVVHPRLVVTAKHCETNPREHKIFLGPDTRRGGRPDELVDIQRVVPHPRTDLALVFLRREIPSHIRRPTPILAPGLQFGPNDAIVEAGYGNTAGRMPEPIGFGPLRSVYVKYHQMTQEGDGRFDGPFIELQSSNGRGACKGDSGGPAYLLRNGSWFFFGVTSSLVSGDCGNGVVAYTYLPDNLDWIRREAAAGGITIEGKFPQESVAPPPVVTTPVAPPAPVEPPDIAAHPLVVEIRRALQAGIIRAYHDNTFRPDAPITRLETAILLHQIVAHTAAASSHPLPASVTTPPYPDIPVTDPFVRVLSFASQRNLVAPFADGGFHSNEEIQRGYFFAAIYKTLKLVLDALGLPSPASLSQSPEIFSDVPAGDWTEAYARALSGLCNAAFATASGRLETGLATTRAYAATAAVRAYGCLLQRAPGTAPQH